MVQKCLSTDKADLAFFSTEDVFFIEWKPIDPCIEMSVHDNFHAHLCRLLSEEFWSLAEPLGISVT